MPATHTQDQLHALLVKLMQGMSSELQDKAQKLKRIAGGAPHGARWYDTKAAQETILEVYQRTLSQVEGD